MVIIISRHPSVCLWTVQAPMAIAVCKWLYIQGHRYKHTHWFEECCMAYILPAGKTLHFVHACYIIRVVVCLCQTHNTPLIVALIPWQGHRPHNSYCNYNRPRANQSLNPPLWIWYQFINMLSKFPVNALYRWFSGQGSSTVSTGERHSCVPGTDVWIVNKILHWFLTDVVSCLLPAAGDSRWNKMQNTAWWLTSDSDTSHGAFCFLKFGLNIKVEA